MLKSVHIMNYLSLIDVKVDLAPLTVLIGKSGTGKTNFVSALRFLRDVLLRRTNLDHARLPAHVALPAQMGFEVTFSVPGIAQEYQYSVVQPFPPNGGRHPDESLTYGGRTLYAQSAGKWVSQPSLTPTPPPQGLMLDALSGVPEILVASLTLTRAIGCYDFPGSVFIGTDASRGHAEPQQGLLDDASNYLTVADRIVSNLQDLVSWREINAAMQALDSSISGVTLQLPGRDDVFVAHDLGDRKVSLRLAQQSEGFRRFLAHLLALYQQPSKQVLLFEEPEKGIYPGALAVLADYMQSATQSGRGQIIMTTHSPQLLDRFPPESIRIVTKDGLATRIETLDAEAIEALRKNLLRPGELLTTVDPATVGAQED